MHPEPLHAYRFVDVSVVCCAAFHARRSALERSLAGGRASPSQSLGRNMTKTSSIVVATCLLLGTSVGSAAAAGLCVPLQGKITNNFISGNSTLGVVALEYGFKRSSLKLKCALVGTGQEAAPGTIHFIHTISCEDKLISLPAYDGSGEVPIHSSIVLDTVGTLLPPGDDNELFRFRETSVPTSVGARGLFFGVTGGQLTVDGIVYKSPVEGIPGSIDMSFSGQACYG
jgi:hypothetical protein